MNKLNDLFLDPELLRKRRLITWFRRSNSSWWAAKWELIKHSDVLWMVILTATPPLLPYKITIPTKLINWKIATRKISSNKCVPERHLLFDSLVVGENPHLLTENFLFQIFKTRDIYSNIWLLRIESGESFMKNIQCVKYLSNRKWEIMFCFSLQLYLKRTLSYNIHRVELFEKGGKWEKIIKFPFYFL